MITDENLLKLKPYLSPLNKLQPDSEFIIRIRDKIFRSIETAFATESKLIIKGDTKAKEVNEHFSDGLLDFIPIPELMETYSFIFIQQKEEIRLWAESCIQIFIAYEELYQQKNKTIEKEIIVAQPQEEIDKLKEEASKDLPALFEHIQNSPDSRNSFIDSFMKLHAKNDIAKMVITEMINDYELENRSKVKYETKTKSDNKSKGRRDKLPQLQEKD